MIYVNLIIPCYITTKHYVREQSLVIASFSRDSHIYQDAIICHPIYHFRQPSSHPHINRSVCRQPSNNLSHLLVSVDPEALVLGHTSQLHILAIQLLLHDLLERLERKHLGLGQRERLVEFVLEFGLGALGAGADGFGVVAVECA